MSLVIDPHEILTKFIEYLDKFDDFMYVKVASTSNKQAFSIM